MMIAPWQKVVASPAVLDCASGSDGDCQFPQERRHFARCVRGKERPGATGEDGRVVMEALYAGYASAGSGSKTRLPFRSQGVSRPTDLWLSR